MMNHIENGMLESKGNKLDEIIEIIKERKKSSLFEFSDWQKIDNLATQMGKKLGKPRIKLLEFEKYL